MASQQGGKTKFIRVKGRVVPIKDKGGASSDKPVKKALRGVAVRKMGADYMKKTAVRDDKLAKTGRKVGNTSLAVGAAGALTAIVSKRWRTAGTVVAGLGALGGLMNHGFASGRSSAAKVRRMAAKDLSGGKINQKKAPAPIGAATQRAYLEWAHIKKSSTGF